MKGKDFMKCVRPRYGLYLLWWCGVWLLMTVPTQLPELYERSLVNRPWEHTSVFSEMMGDAGGRLIMEIPCGLMWGSLSWLLQWGASAAVCRLRPPRLFQRGALPGLWSCLAPIVLLACGEATVFGVPLGNMNAGLVNFSLCTDDSPPVTITDGSIRIESAGIMLAFPLACIVAGLLTTFFAAGRRLPSSAGIPMDGNEVWPPAPTAITGQQQ